MTERDFVYWLQGFFEIRSANGAKKQDPLTAAQVKMIEDHLHYVFDHLSKVQQQANTTVTIPSSWQTRSGAQTPTSGSRLEDLYQPFKPGDVISC